MRVSVGQAAVNALASWLQSQLPRIKIVARWPPIDGARLQQRAISVVTVGKRRRVDVVGISVAAQMSRASGAVFTHEIGHVEQAVQLDIWDLTNEGRDDLIASLDDILNSGDAATTGAGPGVDDVSDGIEIPFNAGDGFPGTFQVWIDEPSIDESPEHYVLGQYRATYLGEIRCPLTVQRTSPRMKLLTLTATTK